MALFGNTPAGSTPAAGSTAAKTERPQSKWWLNFGYTVKVQNAESGEMEDVFIALPYGLPIDTMENSSTQGKDANWINRMSAGNQLLADMKELCETMQPGETRIISGDADTLQVQIRRVQENVAVPTNGENPYLKAAPKLRLVG